MKILIAFFAVLAVATYTSAAVLPQVEELSKYFIFSLSNHY